MSNRTNSQKEVFAASEVAAWCGTDVTTIYSWTRKGELVGQRTPGGQHRFQREVVLDFLRRHHYPVPEELSGGAPRIIAVDDSTRWLSQIRRTLSRSFQVQGYSDPCDGLLAIGRDKPDAVVLDIRMPVLDGLHLIARIRSWKELAHTRLVVFSAYPEEARPAMEAGIAYVAKPETEELHQMLRRTLGL